MTSSPMTSLNYCQKMCSQTRNSCAEAFDNRLRSKNLKPKKSRGGVKASRVKLKFAFHCVVVRDTGVLNCNRL